MAGLPVLSGSASPDAVACASSAPSVEESSWRSTLKESIYAHWDNLQDDPEGLTAVVNFLGTRLSGYPDKRVEGGRGMGGGHGDSCSVSGGGCSDESTRDRGRAVGVITAEGAAGVST